MSPSKNLVVHHRMALCCGAIGMEKSWRVHYTAVTYKSNKLVNSVQDRFSSTCCIAFLGFFALRGRTLFNVSTSFECLESIFLEEKKAIVFFLVLLPQGAETFDVRKSTQPPRTRQATPLPAPPLPTPSRPLGMDNVLLLITSTSTLTLTSNLVNKMWSLKL